MDFTTALFLTQDGITLGAIYAMLALGMVLVYSVTRIIYIPLGDFVTFGALSLAALQAGRTPTLVYLALGVGACCVVVEGVAGRRDGPHLLWNLRRSAVRYLLAPLAGWGFATYGGWAQAPLLLQIAMTFLVVLPLALSLHRLTFDPLRDASTLVLLIAAVGLHLALLGTSLILFGPEGARTQLFSNHRFNLGPIVVPFQAVCVVSALLILAAALYAYFAFTLHGKALRATAFNRLGARLVGVETAKAGRTAALMGAGIGVLCGVLISPMATIYYDSGFVIGLKGFVGAILAGMASFPVALAGAVAVGLIEGYASFVASAFKDSIVFALVIPVLLARSLLPGSKEGAH